MCPRRRPHTDPSHLFAAYIFTFPLTHNYQSGMIIVIIASVFLIIADWPRVTGQVNVSLVSPVSPVWVFMRW